MTDPGHDTPPSVWQRLVGETDRIGWWILPAFVAVGLAGAVMAGTLAIVYYSQQVSALEAETRQGRQEVQGAVEEVQGVRDRALERIRKEVAALDRGRPVEDVSRFGLVVIEARVTSSSGSATAASDGSVDGAPDVLAQQDQQTPQEQQTQQPEQQQTQQPEQQPQEPQPPPIEPRLGVGFAVAVENGATFFATSYGLVEDPTAPGGVAAEVQVTTPGGDRVAGTVHSWDEQRGLALVQAAAGELPIADWRPRGESLAVGEQLTVLGITPQFDPVQLDGVAGWVGRSAIVSTLTSAPEFLRGAPVVDVTGRVVAVHTPAYRPFGSAAGDRQALAPVGLYCDRMLTGCETLEAEATEPPPTEQPTD